MFTPTQQQLTRDFISGSCTKDDCESSAYYTKHKLLAYTSMSLAFIMIHNLNFSQN